MLLSVYKDFLCLSFVSNGATKVSVNTQMDILHLSQISKFLGVIGVRNKLNSR